MIEAMAGPIMEALKKHNLLELSLRSPFTWRDIVDRDRDHIFNLFSAFKINLKFGFNPESVAHVGSFIAMQNGDEEFYNSIKTYVE